MPWQATERGPSGMSRGEDATGPSGEDAWVPPCLLSVGNLTSSEWLPLLAAYSVRGAPAVDNHASPVIHGRLSGRVAEVAGFRGDHNRTIG